MGLTEKNNGFEFTSFVYPFNRKNALYITDADPRSILMYSEYINSHSIEQAEIHLPSLDILYKCRNLKFLKIIPSIDSADNYDFSPIYELDTVMYLQCNTGYGGRLSYNGEIDYLRVNGLEFLSVVDDKYNINYNRIETLKSLSIGEYKPKSRDLTELFSSKTLDTLWMMKAQIKSLVGIDQSNKMQCVYLHRSPMLENINSLSKVSKTLKALRIEKCPKIRDFSVLAELKNLELLELSGSNVLPDLGFLKSMKNLKTFIFDMNVLDGNLSNCLGLSYVYSEKSRKHYNLADKDLPKGIYVRGNENIEEWRRLE